MFKYIFSKVGIYLILLVFILPLAILFILGNVSRKQITDNSVSPSGSPVSQVPLPSKEDVVRSFCNLIDEGRIPQAVEMMDTEDETTKQSWGVYLNNFSSFKVINIKRSSLDENGNSFEVDMDVRLKGNVSGPIPNNGWINGINKRWINLVEKEKGVYRITEIATGP